MSATVTVLGYAAVVVCSLCLEVVARRRRRRVATFGQALDAALRRPALRALLQTGWLWLGWHLFVRVDW